MGKKKKRHIKLNNKIRAYFDGKPFDEGVAFLDDDKLIELLLLLDVQPASFERDEMIRTLRRVWSEGGVAMREAIVSYLTAPHKATHVPAPVQDKVEKILEILSAFEHTKAEEELILEAFIDTKRAKITPEKVHNKLLYLRRKNRLIELERTLGVVFNTLGEMEFTHPFVFAMREIDFTKHLLCVSKPVDFDTLLQQDDETVIAELIKRKEALIAQKQAEIDAFVEAYYAEAHPYINEATAIEALKRLPPEERLEHAPLAFETIERALQSELDARYTLFESGEHYVVEKRTSFTLFDTELPFFISVAYEKRFVYAQLWQRKLPPVKADIAARKEELIAHFNAAVHVLLDEMRELAAPLELDETVLQEHITRFIAPQIASSRTLVFKEKTKRRVLYHFGEYVKPLLEKHKREALLAKTIRDFKRLFPLARTLKRRITFHVGPTNSGKTYAAMQHLKAATTGTYLAPLRLLALEGYETLQKQGVRVSLVTGEEEILDEEATHIASTIEMMNASLDVDVCVIDEIQMIADRDRGWAWANALIGAPAKHVIVTGSENALGIVEALCDYLEEPLEIVRFERKNPLEMLSSPTPLRHIEPKTAVVAFSRRDVLSLKQQLSRRHRVSVVYGNLSPEVRREEARRFREGESDVLVATDAIAMGLNLPVKTILFAKDNKFDGLKRRELLPAEVQQIAGRAGRFGLEEKGYVGALESSVLRTISKALHTPPSALELPVSVMASLEHVLLIGEILETENLTEILTFFADNMEFEGPFVAANIESMLEIAAIVDEYELDLQTRYHLACAPASISSPYIEAVFHRYIRRIEAGKPVLFIPPRELPEFAHTNEMLLEAEDRVREISLYLWLSFKFPELFPDTQKAKETRVRLNRFIENSLRRGTFTKTCRRCGKVLDISYRFSICDSCYAKGKRGETKQRRGYGKTKRRT